MLNTSLQRKDEINGCISAYKDYDAAIAAYTFSREEWVHICYLAVFLRPYALFAQALLTQQGRHNNNGLGKIH
jgi:hypothetical protein